MKWTDIIAIIVPIIVVIIQTITARLLKKDTAKSLIPYVEQSNSYIAIINQIFDLLISQKTREEPAESKKQQLLSCEYSIEQLFIKNELKDYVKQLIKCFINASADEASILLSEVCNVKTRLMELELAKQNLYHKGIGASRKEFDRISKDITYFVLKCSIMLVVPIIILTFALIVSKPIFSMFGEQVYSWFQLVFVIVLYSTMIISSIIFVAYLLLGLYEMHKQNVPLRMQKDWHKLLCKKDYRKKYELEIFEIFHYEIDKKERKPVYKLFVKRLLDIVCSLLGLILLMPFFLIFTPIVAIAMHGNPFFTQKRPGKKGVVFTVIKYRTMTNKKDKDGNLLPDKDRLTKFGKIMRALSIDELPELINIFCGKMSIVGPRPLREEYLDIYNDFQKRRHEVRPGLTGLAQVEGRNNTTWQARFEQDVKYVDNCSFWLDVKIFFKTILKVFKREGISQEGNATMEFFQGNDETALTDTQVDSDDGIDNNSCLSVLDNDDAGSDCANNEIDNNHEEQQLD